MRKRFFALVMFFVVLFVAIPIEGVHAADSPNTGTLHAYPAFDERIERDFMYTVSVTDSRGTTVLPVYNHTEDSRIARNPNDGYAADEWRRFSTFAFEGTVTVHIQVNCDFESYSILPSAKGLPSEFDASTGTIRVTLSNPEYFVVRLNGSDSTNLAILADAPETDIPVDNTNTIIVDGWQEYPNGVLTLDKPGTTVYIKPGAVLNARILITANDCKVIGRGAVVDPAGNVYDYNAAQMENGVVSVLDADGAYISGIHILDSKSYNLTVNGTWGTSYAENTEIRDVKILSTQMCSDGIGFGYYNQNSSAEHCFIYCGDNALVCEENGAAYSDIVIGTTCNPIFLQTDVRNSLIENIYVFRADASLVKVAMAGSGDTTVMENVRIQNLHTEDATYIPMFFAIDETTKNFSGSGLTVTNVWLPRASDVKMEFFYNNYISLEGLALQINNLSIAGNLITSKSDIQEGSWCKSYRSTDYYALGTLTTTPAFSPAAAPHSATVNYQAEINVLIGREQAWFASPVLKEEETVYLPYQELAAQVNMPVAAKTVEKNGIVYVPHTELTACKMVSSAVLNGNTLTLTPYNIGENLLREGTGIVSEFTEAIPWEQHLTALNTDADGARIYRSEARDSSPHADAGIACLLDREIKCYGVGSYVLRFDAKADESGSLKIGIDYGVQADVGTTQAIQTSWSSFSIAFDITDAHLQDDKIVMLIQSDTTALSAFEIKNVCLTKSDGVAAGATVIWKVRDQVTQQRVVPGATPVYPGANPEAVQNGTAWLVFSGWSPEIAAVTEDVTYIAQYDAVPMDTFNFVGTQMRTTDNAVRFIGTVADYQDPRIDELGFVMTVNGQQVFCEITKVYSRLLANGISVTPDRAGETFFTFVLSDIPKNTVFEVGGYAVVNGSLLIGSAATLIFTGNDMVSPGLNLRENNAIEDTAAFNEIFGDV